MTAPGPRDPQAGQDHAEWLGWAEAQGYPLDTGDRPEHAIGDMRDAFKAGVQYARDLDAATLAAEVRAGHVRIETGGTAPGQAALLAEVLGTFSPTSVVGGPTKGDAVSLVGMSRLRQWHEQAEAIAARQPQPGHLLVMRGTIALRDAEIELLRKQLARTREEAGAVRRKLDIASTALCRLTTAAYPAEARVTASQALDAMDRVSVRDVAAPEKP